MVTPTTHGTNANSKIRLARKMLSGVFSPLTAVIHTIDRRKLTGMMIKLRRQTYLRMHLGQAMWTSDRQNATAKNIKNHLTNW
jgi:hypothetical protein